jgi:hypothetical protein
MERWEYCLKQSSMAVDMLSRGHVETLLNTAGREGWELVAVEKQEGEHLLIMKRLLPG